MSARAWHRRRRRVRWDAIARQLNRVPFGTPVVRRMGGSIVTVTAWPYGHRDAPYLEDDRP